MLFADMELYTAAVSMVPLLLVYSVLGFLQALILITLVAFSIFGWTVLLWV